MDIRWRCPSAPLLHFRFPQCGTDRGNALSDLLHDIIGTVLIQLAGGPEITPDHFEWYFYQGRVIGIQVDLNCGSICNGKILLGSYTKKPLWVDHSATTVSTRLIAPPFLSSCTPSSFYLFLISQVFNLLTGSVSVIINGCESRVDPAQSFMVPCGENTF